MKKYYDRNFKQTGYSSKTIFGDKCIRGMDGKVKAYHSTDIFGNKCMRGTDGKIKGYRR